jgi:pimeloyl-ACP methyl ester carboxylesterase
MPERHHSPRFWRRLRRALPIVALLAALAAGWRLLRPRPVQSPARQAEPDSRFLDVGGLRVHYKQAGTGSPVLLLVHGSFLNLHSWDAVLAPLAEHATVIAFDRPAFGLTDRPLPADEDDANPYSPEGQADLLIALLDGLGIQQAVLVGSSAGGTTSLLAALRYPERVQALVLVDAMVYSGYAVSEFPAWLRPLLDAAAPLWALLVRGAISALHDTALRSFWHDPAKLTPEALARYRQNIQVARWERALWELIRTSHALNLEGFLETIRMPTLVLTGEHDRTVSAEESVRLARALPNADLVTIAACGHLPHEEQPTAFLEAVRAFLRRITD